MFEYFSPNDVESRCDEERQVALFTFGNVGSVLWGFGANQSIVQVRVVVEHGCGVVLQVLPTMLETEDVAVHRELALLELTVRRFRRAWMPLDFGRES